MKFALALLTVGLAVCFFVVGRILTTGVSDRDTLGERTIGQLAYGISFALVCIAVAIGASR